MMFASDLVDGEVWENVNFGTSEERKKQINCFEIALQLTELMIMNPPSEMGTETKP